MNKFEKLLHPVRAVKVEMRQYYLGGNCIEEPLTLLMREERLTKNPPQDKPDNAL